MTDFQALLGDAREETRLEDSKPPWDRTAALAEANRCLFCYDAPCIQACPTAIDIPRFIKQIASDNVRGSAKTILSVNMLGASCARVCPVEELCAGACVMNDYNKTPIQIGRLQRYATDNALANEKKTGRKLFQPKPATGKKVALIGAGPASLACAAHLALEGVHPVIFERDELPGGLNTTGVAPYKLHAQDSLEEVEWLLGHGVDLHCGVTVGEEVSFEDLRRDFDAVFIGVGLGADRMLGFDGEGIWGATELIRAIKNDTEFVITDDIQTAIIVGGGNTAIDIARELAMLGVPDVTTVYRRSEADMSGYKHEMEAARKHGVKLETGLSPKSASQKGGFTKVNFETADSELITTQADMVVMAVGQAKWAQLIGAEDLAFNDNGTVIVNPESRETSIEGVYAGGDCINGGKEVVNAAADGREAAFAMLEAFSSQQSAISAMENDRDA